MCCLDRNLLASSLSPFAPILVPSGRAIYVFSDTCKRQMAGISAVALAIPSTGTHQENDTLLFSYGEGTY